MSEMTLAVWGRAMLPPEAEASAEDGRWEPEIQQIAQQLRSFLGREIERWRPDLIIVHERKGTAILRTLIEAAPADLRLEWPWRKVVSSAALSQLPPGALREKRLLIFDDMMRTGKHIRTVLTHIRAASVDGNAPSAVRSAVFAVHEDARLNGHASEMGVSSVAFHRDLTTRAYRSLRQRIVRMLQVAGSLMLDTEHVEVRLMLRGTFQELVDAVHRSGLPVEFESTGRRKNITVFYPEDAAHELPAERFPIGTRFTNIVKKCRLVHREGNEFAIIPICLPLVPKDTPWATSEADREMLGSGVDQSPDGRFYAAALLGSLFPLRWLIRDLYASNESCFSLELPTLGAPNDGGYSLDHLLVMYPTLDIDALVEEVLDTCSEASGDGRRLRDRHRDVGPVYRWPNEQLSENALSLLQLIGHVLDQRHTDEGLYSEAGTVTKRSGLTVREIFLIGKHQGWEDQRISTLFDLLIDDASLVTRVEEMQDEAGLVRLTRTFKPDGEVVSDLLRSYTRQWGFVGKPSAM
jgi:hypothetical protein